MSAPGKPASVILLFAYFSKDISILDKFEKKAKKKYGPCIFSTFQYNASEYTSYYHKEMGEALYKRIIAFKTPLKISKIYKTKLWAYKMEQTFQKKGRRSLNIDPGCLQLENFILLTFKRFSHRIYIRKGVYGDLTLMYNSKKKSYIPLPWTYPDFKNESILELLWEVREYFISLPRTLK